jgi:tRNA pseudouridine13 synthase
VNRGRRPDAWTRAALDPPRAHGVPLSRVEIKTEPEDFRVEEQLSFVPSGEGPHWLLRIEKRAANTRWVAAELARLGELPAADVGYAGLKDRHAISVQWFSVPARNKPREFWQAQGTEEFEVLEAHANSRKLKRGALSGNLFRIRLRRVAWLREELEAKLAALRAYGVPNYFGPQRFGREGRNLDRVADWLERGVKAAGRAERGFALSAARSLIFNAVLARRVESANWGLLQPGDQASLDGSGSHFAVTGVDDELSRRIEAFDIHPSGPMWGRGEPQSEGRVRELELEVAREFGPVAKLLASEGLEQERRPLRCAVRHLRVEADRAEADAGRRESGVGTRESGGGTRESGGGTRESGEGTLTLSFSLGRGQFATAVLREIAEISTERELEAED